MRKLRILFVVFVLAGVVETRAQANSLPKVDASPDTLAFVDPQMSHEAVLYHQKLLAPLQDFRKANFEYIQSVTKLRWARAIERKRQALLTVIQSMTGYYKNSNPFFTDSMLKVAFIRYLDMDYAVLKQDFDKILDMEEIEAKSYDQEEAHQVALDLACEKLNVSYDSLKKVEDDFFKKYRIIAKHEKDELELKMERADSALEYYNAVAKISSKVSRENSYASQAAQNKDVAGMQQHATTLVSFSDSGMGQLKQKTAYQGDNELLTTAIALLEFYRHQGQVTYPANIDFCIKTDNFQKAGEKLNSIKEGDRKKEDVDQYNNEVNLYNKAVKDINNINKESYKAYQKLIDSWKKQTEKFFRKHA